ncbi:hypothetical protein Q7M82_03240 [Candidatus Liberibacter asiaticus]
MRLENGLAISMILHVMFLLLLYFNFNVQLLVPISRREMLSVDNIYNEDYHSSKYKKIEEPVVQFKGSSQENLVRDFTVQENGDRFSDQTKTLATENETKRSSSSKGEQALKESALLRMPVSPYDKQKISKATNKEQDLQGISFAEKKSIDTVVVRPDKKELLSKVEKSSRKRIPSQDAIAIVRNRVIANWNIPSDFKRFKKLRVKMHFQLNQKGFVLGKINVDVVGGTELVRRMLRENARKAVIKSQAFRLSPSTYKSWRNITLFFVPSKM